MPLFDFTCRACSHTFEALVSRSEEANCPKCTSKELEKLLSAFAIGGPREVGAMCPPAGCGSCGDPRGPGACSFSS